MIPPYYTISIMPKYSFLLAVFVLILSLTIFFNRGFSYYDEGFILHAAERIVSGEIPYRDFDFIYTPGTIFLVALGFKLFGESILVGRVLTMSVAILTALLIYFVTNRITKNKLLSFFSLLVYLSWGPMHINFPWPTLFALSTGLLSTFFLSTTLMGSLDSKKSSLGMTTAFLAGMMGFVTFLFKQNLGMAVLLSSLLSLIIVRKAKMKSLIVLALGVFMAFAVFLTYLLLTKSTKSFIDNFYFYTVKTVLLDQAFATDFPKGLKSLIYLFPGLVSLASLIFVYRNKKNYIHLPLFTLFFYLFGIRPTTDFVHLVLPMASIGIPLSLILLKAKQKIFVYGLFLSIIVSGFYTGLWKNYYRWDSSLIKQTYFIEDPRTRILVDQKFNRVIPEVLTFISGKSKKSDNIFVFYNAAMFYFLSERKNPTRYINFSPDLSLGGSREKGVINNLKEKNVKIVLTHESPDRWGNPLITKFILKNYQKKKEIFEFAIWEKK